MKRFATATALVLGALGLAPALARAQPFVDLAIEAVRVRPSQAKAGETISVAATVRRVDPQSAKGAPPSVEAEIEFVLAGEARAFATRRVSLGPGKSAAVAATWAARDGQHAFRVRIGRMTARGADVRDTNAANNEQTSAALLIRSALQPPVTQPAPLPAGPPAPPQFQTAQAGVGLPDLVVEDIYWSINFGLSYRLRNRGGASSGPFQVAVHGCPSPEFPFPAGAVGGPRFFNEKPLEAGATRVRETRTWQPRGTQCKVRVVADSGGVVAEADESNNELTRVLILPDLKITNVDRHRNGHPDVSFAFKVKNGGAIPSLSYWIKYVVSGQQLWTGPFPGLAPGAAREFRVSDRLPTGEHELDIYVSALLNEGGGPDSAHLQDRVTRRYNKRSTTPLPDLRITNMDRHRNGHSDAYITFRVKNAGAASSPPYRIRYWVTPNDNRVDAYYPPSIFEPFLAIPDPSPGLGPGEVREHQVRDQLPSGRLTLHIVVDPDNAIPEENETNNTAQQNYRKE